MLKERTLYKEGLPVNILVANIKEYPIHFHNEIEVVYVLDGSIFLKNGYYTYTLKQGDIFILNDKEIHSYYRTGEDNIVLLLQIDVSYFSNYYDNFRNCFFITDLNDEINENGENDQGLETLRGILGRIMMEYMQKNAGFEHKVIENTHNLIACLISDFQYYTMEDGKFVNKIKLKGNKVLAGRLRRITDYMYENYFRKLTLCEIAEREHLSVFYLSHIIKMSTGMNFQELLSFIRVEESEKLLLGTDKRIGAISDECGFSAVRYYIKHFSEWFGMPPAEYRKKFTGKVSSREIHAVYDSIGADEIEAIIKERAREIYDEYICRGKSSASIIDIDIADCMADRRKKNLFPEGLFDKEMLKAAIRPYSLFKNLNEPVLFTSSQCAISAGGGDPSNLGSLSVLAYNYDDEFYKKLMSAAGKENFIELLKTYDEESEILVRCAGITGNFRVNRYKMSKQNVICACEDWTKATATLNKRQAILNSWSTLPNIETGEITVSGMLNLRLVLRGFSAELILIDRK